ncbi:hypothetical protein [Nocardioides sp. T2.26MG-1]|uniref:hypothetical protein n=1 Tax=Nocardioides sp. T2.26MG-1 TaxID=3041166 RepID=UPI0024778FC9|nr:hypothetical protein [Nocardioides sp. T2.26MG-1]CAI9408368.1 hypothetical protein HIDPHFAB_01064 [Nocardioides sp. T2.26MG-1]
MPWDPEEEDRRIELLPLYYDNDMPPGLNHELWTWANGRIRPASSGVKTTNHPVFVIATAMHLGADAPHGKFGDMQEYFKRNCSNGEFLLRTIHTCLQHLPAAGAAEYLEVILKRGRSGYTVRTNTRGLEYRVTPAAREQVEEAVRSTPEPVGQLLTKAWNEAYGVEGDPFDAYMAAFRAAETVLRPVISPNDGDARLGKMIRDYEANPNKWEFLLTESRPGAKEKGLELLDGRETVMQMVRTIAYGQKDRHVFESDENSVTEARAAVHLAVTIAMMCETGAFRRKPE